MKRAMLVVYQFQRGKDGTTSGRGTSVTRIEIASPGSIELCFGATIIPS